MTTPEPGSRDGASPTGWARCRWQAGVLLDAEGTALATATGQAAARATGTLTLHTGEGIVDVRVGTRSGRVAVTAVSRPASESSSERWIPEGRTNHPPSPVTYEAIQRGFTIRIFDARCGADRYTLTRGRKRQRVISRGERVCAYTQPGGLGDLTCVYDPNPGQTRLPVTDLAFLTWVCAHVDAPTCIVQAEASVRRGERS